MDKSDGGGGGSTAADSRSYARSGSGYSASRYGSSGYSASDRGDEYHDAMSQSIVSRSQHERGTSSVGMRTVDDDGRNMAMDENIIDDADPPTFEDEPFIDDDDEDGQGPPVTLYDLFFDLPHPAASPGCPRARVIDSPSAAAAAAAAGEDGRSEEAEAADAAARAVMDELFDPSNISRIARFAFPEHDDELHAAEVAEMRYKQQLLQQASNGGDGGNGSGSGSGGPVSNSSSSYPDGNNSYDDGMSVISASAVPSAANLNRYDMYLKSFRPQSHHFTLQLADGTRIHGHVRRYLPTHTQSSGRSDAGRRGARAMVLLTRATGGERFYSALLKTVESLYMERDGIDTTLAPDEIPARTFLHAMHNHHCRLMQQARDIVAAGGTLNYSAIDGQSAAEAARTFMAQNKQLFRIALSGIEFGGYSSLDDMDSQTDQLGRIVVSGDSVRLQLPPSLQPGYEATHTCTVEDLHSPILPLLRCLGAPHTLRLLSALMCENRIILVSKSPSKLSTCVRAASAMLAQGLLVWRHVQIPVLPPHLLKYLTSDSPYLIGLLEQFASNLDVLPMMQSVLCVNLDWNELRTYNMPNAAASIPDLLKPVRRARTADDVFSPAEFLAKDMADVLKNDRSVWSAMTGGRTGGAPSVGTSPSALGGGVPDDGANGTVANGTAPSTRNGIMSKMTPLTGMLGLRKKDDGRSVTNGSSGGDQSMDEAQKTADMAAFMGSVMRNARNPALKYQSAHKNRTVRGGDADDDISSVGDDMSVHGDHDGQMAIPQNDRALGPDAGLLPGFYAVEAEGTCENERAEEEIRAAFTCFYLYIFGDMGMYLSEAEDGSLWLDRKKFLIRKKQMGDRESSPMFAVCLSLSRSLMFESFVRGRIADLERPTVERAKMMPHHIPLFVYCEKYLRINRLKFTMANIRRVVSTTVLACPQHAIVDETERIRSKALALTSNEPFKGNVVTAVEGLVSDCRDVNSALPQVMAVIFARMTETRAAYWRHPLLALHLLKNLILHGPLTAIADATDGIEKVRALQTFHSKNAQSAREVQLVAKQVFILLTDRNRLFFKRRRAGVERTYNPKSATDTLRFSDYLLRRLPVTTGFRNMHVLLRPTKAGLPSAGNIASSSNTISTVPANDESLDHLPHGMDVECEDFDQDQMRESYFDDNEDASDKYEYDPNNQYTYEPDNHPDENDGEYEEDSGIESYDSLAKGVEDKMLSQHASKEIRETLSLTDDDHAPHQEPSDEGTHNYGGQGEVLPNGDGDDVSMNASNEDIGVEAPIDLVEDMFGANGANEDGHARDDGKREGEEEKEVLTNGEGTRVESVTEHTSSVTAPGNGEVGSKPKKKKKKRKKNKNQTAAS